MTEAFINDSSPISLRPMTQEDLPQVLKIEGLSHVRPWKSADFIGEMAKKFSHVWVLTDDETDEQIFGFVVFWILEGEGYILDIVVDPEFRGLGYGRRMLLKAVGTCLKAQCRRVILEVRKSNQGAIELYQKQGFSTIQVRKGFYSDGEDAYQMELKLSGQDSH